MTATWLGVQWLCWFSYSMSALALSITAPLWWRARRDNEKMKRESAEITRIALFFKEEERQYREFLKLREDWKRLTES